MRSPRERLHGLLLEHLTPVRLHRLFPSLGGTDGLPRQPASVAWFVWRAIQQVHVPTALPVLCQELPQHAAEFEEIGEDWIEEPLEGQPLLLEFHQPDGRISVRAIEELLAELQRSSPESLSLVAVFYGVPYLRPQPVLLLELTASEAASSRLLQSDSLLSSLSPGGCPLAQVHAKHELLWSRPPEVIKLPSSTHLAVAATGTFLMIVMLLIAVPNFVSMGSRAKRSEIPANVDGIKTAQVAYEATFDHFVEQPDFVPEERPGKRQRPWPTGTAFDTLGWAPDGQVRGSYKLITLDCYGAGCRASDFRVFGVADSDGDGEIATYTSQKSINAVLVTPNSVY